MQQNYTTICTQCPELPQQAALATYLLQQVMTAYLDPLLICQAGPDVMRLCDDGGVRLQIMRALSTFTCKARRIRMSLEKAV